MPYEESFSADRGRARAKYYQESLQESAAFRKDGARGASHDPCTGPNLVRSMQTFVHGTSGNLETSGDGPLLIR